MSITEHSRRQFLRYLAASPVAGALSGIPLAGGAEAVTRAADAIDIFDLRETARSNIPTAHWGYLATGVNGDSILRINKHGEIELRCKSEWMLVGGLIGNFEERLMELIHHC